MPSRAYGKWNTGWLFPVGFFSLFLKKYFANYCTSRSSDYFWKKSGVTLGVSIMVSNNILSHLNRIYMIKVKLDQAPCNPGNTSRRKTNFNYTAAKLIKFFFTLDNWTLSFPVCVVLWVEQCFNSVSCTRTSFQGYHFKVNSLLKLNEKSYLELWVLMMSWRHSHRNVSKS